MHFQAKLPPLKREIIEFIAIFLAGAVIQKLLLEGEINDWPNIQWIWVIMTGTFWVTLWKGSQYLVILFDGLGIHWQEQPIKRLVLAVASIFGYVVIINTAVFYIFIVLLYGYTNEEFLNWLSPSQFYTSLIITFAINVFMHGRAFLMEWRQAAIDVEKLKTENVKTKFESLKSQVNPHFLFNSLNAISSLVYADQAKAVAFIQKLSGVYRYVLEHQSDEVVELDKEVEFLKSFAYLNSLRFGENFNISYTGFDDKIEGFVPPVVLQMLVENCIKHNEISKSFPLNISVVKEADFVEVTNNKNPLNKPRVDSNGLGLSNIKSRYQLLTDKGVEVSQDESHFAVKVPILSLS